LILILYFCPDSPVKSAGIRILHDHVDILNRHGQGAAILHNTEGFRVADVPDVPVRYLSSPNAIQSGDIVVVPEGYPRIMSALKSHPVRRIAIALNWKYVYNSLPDRCDWRTFNVERVLTYSALIGEFTSWAMGLPYHLFQVSIDPKLYYCDAKEKGPQVCYLYRKQGEMPELRRALWSRNHKFLDAIVWVPLDGMSEADYARQVRRSSIFLNLSPFEGVHIPLLEAMRCGTLVAGYTSVGSQRELTGAGERQNCILAETMDYVTLARKLEQPLLDLMAGNMSRWDQIRANALAATEIYTPAEEEATVLAMWKTILG
jgi:hypothetical protein